ncbi:MAG: glycosyltransferase, partial [Candidatus Hydrothermota bacterium]
MREIVVLYLIDSLRAGGAERVLYNTVEYFRESGLPVRPEIALLYDGGYLSD